ncbi:IPT/TIG domain-containing protein [Streptomyces sp. NPDC059649]|uniref:IPT/TIG domain-containing protein n=1 Tax=Streptomyces sp. NPDC059649 TaxID=3346895 RepID=UPI003691DA20
MTPFITSISPTTQSHHAVPMTIMGTGPSRVIRVNFGTRSVTPTSVTSTTVTCMIPELPAGQYNVSVAAGSLTSNSLPFYYIGPPKVTSLTPNTGPFSATSLSVFGENLVTTTSVAFGDVGVATDGRCVWCIPPGVSVRAHRNARTPPAGRRRLRRGLRRCRTAAGVTVPGACGVATSLTLIGSERRQRVRAADPRGLVPDP